MRDDDSYRWGDDPRDHRALDAWLTREPEPHPGDLLDVSDLGAAAGLTGPAWVTAEAWEALHGEVEDALAAAARRAAARRGAGAGRRRGRGARAAAGVSGWGGAQHLASPHNAPPWKNQPMATTLYTLIVPTEPKLPAGLVTRITVQRADGGEFSREELEAIAAAYPPPPEARAAVEAAIAAAPSKPTRRASASAASRKAQKPAPTPRGAVKVSG